MPAQEPQNHFISFDTREDGRTLRNLRRYLLLLCLPIVCLGLIWSCGSPEDRSELFNNLFVKISAYVFEPSPQVTTIPPPASVVTEELQALVMKQLEQRGFRFADLLALGRYGARPQAAYKSLNELVNKNAWYLDMVQDLEREIDTHAKTDDFNIRSNDNRNRLFDKRWLRSSDANFELIGLVNRIDQRAFDPETSCGEVRLIYRLSYDKTSKKGGFSRLPMTANLVYSVPKTDTSCRAAALRWQVPSKIDTPNAYLDWLVQSPLQNGNLSFKQLEINLQVSRIVASNKPDFGGSATYFLKIYAQNELKRFVPTKLRNTVDTARIASDSVLRAELLQYIGQHLSEIDQGVYNIPEKFLTTKSVSRTTHGLNRLGNMPFGQTLSVREFSGLSYEGLKLINSPQALLRRLEDGSCAGCHQGDSVAGFHLLGLEANEQLHPLNSLRVGYSQHFRSEMMRRQREIKDLMADTGGQPPIRPFSFQSDRSLSPKVGHRCISSSHEKFLQPGAAFGCGPNLNCEVLEDNDQLSFEIGTCLRPQPTAGDACVKGTLKSDLQNPDKDKLTNTTFACQGTNSSNAYVCLQPEQGVPGGLCYRKCTADLKSFSPDSELCAYNGGSAFDSCAASGDFSTCLLQGTTRGLRQACDDNTPCREDFICQTFFGIDNAKKKISTAADKRGYCVPTYFIFQLRLDGHPVP